MPVYRITELFKRVNAETSAFDCFTNANGRQHHDRDVLMATIWATASNLPLEKMAASSPGMSARQLAWAHEHFLSEENFQAAADLLNGLQHHMPLASCWGNGTKAAFDGQFVNVGRKRLGYSSFNGKYSKEPGVKLADTVTDQHAPLHTKVMPASAPEIIHVLDGLAQHKSGLRITEHMMDTGAVSDHIFAIGRLMNTIINPRYRDFHELRFGIMRPARTYKHFLPLLGNPINTTLIIEHYDDILRLGASIKKGKVLPSHVLRQITTRHQQNQFSKALAEFGRIDRTDFMLRWISDPEFRRDVQVMLNKNEMGHILTDTIRIHRQGVILDRTQEHQSLRGKAIQFVRAMVVWANTKDGGDVVQRLRAEGQDITPEVLAHISPLGTKHILFNGDYPWRTPWEGFSKRRRIAS
jgi:TnpA family transposase